MNLSKRLKMAMDRKGFKTQKALADAAEISEQWVSDLIKRPEKPPSLKTVGAVARVLGIDPGALISIHDEVFLAALDEAMGADPDFVDDVPAAKKGGASLLRSLPVATRIDGLGRVTGALALDVITRPSGKPGSLLQRQHAQRGVRDKPAEHVMIEAIPIGAELVRADASLELHDDGEARRIYKDDFLVVDRERAPEPGRYVIAKRDVADPRAVADETTEGPEVSLFRYHPAGRGWSLEPIDGSGKNVGPGDGWVIVASVLFWRTP